MPETPEYDDPLSEASTSPDILAALIKALAKPECAAATIDEIFELLPPFDQNAYIQILDTHSQALQHQIDLLRNAREQGSEIVDVLPPDLLTEEPTDWLGKTMHRLNRLVHEEQQKEQQTFATFLDTLSDGYEKAGDLENVIQEYFSLSSHNPLNFYTISLPLISPRDMEHFTSAFESAHALWKDVYFRHPEHPDEFKHPLAPIVEECLKAWAPKVNPETRPTQIMPKALHSAHTAETQEEIPLGLFAEQGIQRQLMIPGMINDDSSIVPAFPLDVFDASDGKPPERGGKGAPLEQRIWVNAILALPHAIRERDESYRLTTTLRDIKEWAYPNSWRRNEYLPRIRQALKDVHNMRVYWERREWNIVQVFALPTSDVKLDDPLPLLLRLPDGMPGEGPMINVTILRLLGVQSAPQFRAWIKLAYIWDDAKLKNNKHRIYATRPKVVRNKRNQVIDSKGAPIPKNNWNHPKAQWLDELEENPAIKHIPLLSDDDLIRLFFDDKPVSTRTYKWRRKTARQQLEDMEENGYIVVQELPEGVRILEPGQPDS